MTLQQLQYLMEVYRTGSISGAAKRLFLSQSSLSASIGSLESELGFPVFLRQKSGMVPTVQGIRVIEHAARICESYQQMITPDNNQKRSIHISMPVYAPLDSAFTQLVENCSHSDNLIFSADTYPTAEAVTKLSALELDIVVLMNHASRILSVETLLQSKGLQWKQLATIPAYVQLGAGHRLYRRETLSPDDLENDLFVDDIHDPLLYNDFLKGIIHLRPEHTVSVRSTHARNLLVSKGQAFSIGPKQPDSICATYGLRNIPLVDVSYVVTVATNPLNAPTREAEAFCQLILRALSGNTNPVC